MNWHEAASLAREMGVKHLVIDSDELTLPEFRSNPAGQMLYL